MIVTKFRILYRTKYDRKTVFLFLHSGIILIKPDIQSATYTRVNRKKDVRNDPK